MAENRTQMADLFIAADGRPRCAWSGTAPEFGRYHDEEWGFPVSDDRELFEKICLELFQSGLSWRTILSKRENFRTAFSHFDFYAVSQFNEHDIERLLNDDGIVRHRGKIAAVINNAKKAKDTVDREGSLASFFWAFEPDPISLGSPQSRSSSETSKKLSNELKARGWKFVGPTTVYAFMQAMGLVNDHALGCAIRERVDAARARFVRPGKKG